MLAGFDDRTLPYPARSLRSAIRCGVSPKRLLPAPVAQLDRVLASEAKGHRFESCRGAPFDTGRPASRDARVLSPLPAVPTTTTVGVTYALDGRRLDAADGTGHDARHRRRAGSVPGTGGPIRLKRPWGTPR